MRPVRGYRYGIGREREISKVVAPPYDQIDAEAHTLLYAMSPANIVRVSYPRDEEGRDRYAAARAALDAWLAEGVWGREESPAIYPYHQIYRVGAHEVTRVGLVALGQVTDYVRGEVRPHERTHTGPKEDRMRLLEATAADTGLLFMLVADPSGALLEASVPGGDPIAEARDLKGERHRLWRVTDAAAIGRVQAALAVARVIIADGHHRYETAVEYSHRHPGADDKLMAFFSLDAPGLTIFPNHRLVRDLAGFSLARLAEGARRWFDVEPLEEPEAFTPTNRSLGVVTADAAISLTLRPEAFESIAWPARTSRAWRELAVSILHEGVLKPLLGITDEALDAKTHVDYVADQAEAVRAAREGRCQAAFLIAPTTAEELQAVVRGGEVLPQKSTHFYPKLLDGLVFHKLGD
ncbi:MAG TPA: DUF1015 domain-containing protein [Methylomirabilota bacterium]|nr:DUF1015 domain-containing protein [Methylomirabilota bacterium]